MWKLLSKLKRREPEPVQYEGTMVVPDFYIKHIDALAKSMADPVLIQDVKPQTAADLKPKIETKTVTLTINSDEYARIMLALKYSPGTEDLRLIKKLEGAWSYGKS